MRNYEVAHLDEIDELNDGRRPYRPVRHHFGITAFGVNAWTAPEAGDRIINEHDEADDGNEELYLVTQGRAVFQLDGERVDAPAGTLVFARPAVAAEYRVFRIDHPNVKSLLGLNEKEAWFSWNQIMGPDENEEKLREQVKQAGATDEKRRDAYQSKVLELQGPVEQIGDGDLSNIGL